MNTKKANRLDKIKKLLMTQTGISLKEFIPLLGVSEITIRRDLQFLEAQGIVRLINGVAIYRNNDNLPMYPEYNLQYEQTIFQKNKERIGKKAASLIEPNDVVAIDCGSTTSYLSRNLPYDIHITVLTSSMNVLMDLNDHHNCNIICAGGYLYPNTRMFHCPEGISMIQRTCINKVFISAAGVSEKLNVTCIAPHEMDAKRSLMDSGQTRILLIDSSKFGKIFPTVFSHIRNFDVIITDKDLSEDWISEIKALGITLYCE